MGSGEPISDDIYVSAMICRTVFLSDVGLPTLFGVTTQVVSTPVAVMATKDSKPAQLLIFTPIETSLLIAVYSDTPHTAMKLGIKFRMPNGETVEPDEESGGGSKTVDLEAEENGHFFNVALPINPQIAGLYWAEIYIDGKLKTKTPLRVMHAPPGVLIAEPEGMNIPSKPQQTPRGPETQTQT